MLTHRQNDYYKAEYFEIYVNVLHKLTFKLCFQRLIVCMIIIVVHYYLSGMDFCLKNFFFQFSIYLHAALHYLPKFNLFLHKLHSINFALFSECSFNSCVIYRLTSILSLL